MTSASNVADSTKPRTAPVTAVIPVYNYERYVGATIESVLAQTLPFEEIFVINDGSTDGSLEVAQRYGDRVRVIDAPNRGQMGASYSVLPLIKSKYVHFVDADDLIEPTLNETLAPHFADDYVKIQFMLKGIDHDGKPTASLFPHFPQGYDAAAMRRHNSTIGFYICPPTTANIYATSFLKSLDMDKMNLRDSTDGTPAMIAPYYGEVLSVPIPLGSYRVHFNNNWGHWHSPNAESLVREIDLFKRRWDEAAAMRPGTPIPGENCHFVAERRLFQKALQGRVPLRDALYYMRVLRNADMGGMRLAAHGLTAALLTVAPSEMRRKSILALRSPKNRSAVLNSAIARWRRMRLAMLPSPPSGQHAAR